MAAVTCSPAAMSRAMTFTPPRPPSSGTTALPSSATASTGRFGALFQQQRRQCADDDAGGAQGNDRRVLLIQLAQGRAELLIDPVGALDTAGQAMDLRRRIHLLDAPGGGQAALTENDNGGGGLSHQPCHRSPGTMISEKYGEDIGST